MSENRADISKLDPREHIRSRPGMYFGGIDSEALHRLVFEIVENSIGQAVKGLCNRIQVVLQDSGCVTVADNGAGIPVKTYQETGKSFLEFVLTEIGGSRNLERELRTFAAGWHGIGLAVINIGCTELTIQIKRNGFLWEQRYEQGKPQGELARVRPLDAGEETGTTITFTPDFTIFDKNDFSYSILYRRLRELAFLTRGLKITLEDRRTKSEGQHIEFYFPNGIEHYVNFLNRDYASVHAPIVMEKTVKLKRGETVYVELALQYSNAPDPMLLGFVNTFSIEDGGTHVEGFLSGLDEGLDTFSYKRKLVRSKKYNFIECDIMEGLTAVISVWNLLPEYEGCGRLKLINLAIEPAIHELTTKAINQFSKAYPEDMLHIVEKVLANKQLRKDAELARQARRYGNALTFENDAT